MRKAFDRVDAGALAKTMAVTGIRPPIKDKDRRARDFIGAPTKEMVDFYHMRDAGRCDDGIDRRAICT